MNVRLPFYSPVYSAAFLCVITCGASYMPSAARAAERSADASGRVQLPSCEMDARGAAEFRGYLRVSHQSTRLASVVQIYTNSDEADYYLQGLAFQLSGQKASVTPEQVADPNFLTDRVRRMQALPALLQSVKYAIVDNKGRFECSGILPGRYELLGMAMSEQDSGKRGFKRVKSFWRADATVPQPNRRRAYAISSFRFIGATPSL